MVSKVLQPAEKHFRYSSVNVGKIHTGIRAHIYSPYTIPDLMILTHGNDNAWAPQPTHSDILNVCVIAEYRHYIDLDVNKKFLVSFSFTLTWHVM